MVKESHCPLTPNALAYTWRQLAQRAGVSFSTEAVTGFEELGLPVYYGAPEQAALPSPGLIVIRCADSAWESLLSAPENSLQWLSATETIPHGARLPFDNQLPIIFWGEKHEGSQPFAEFAPDGSIIFHADILASTFFMLSRWEETVGSGLDKHGRSSAHQSAAYKQGFLDLPVVDQYALVLRTWIKSILPAWQPLKNSPAINLTHDIDNLYQYSNPISFVSKTFAAFLSSGGLSGIAHQFKNLRTQFFRPEDGLYYRAIFDLADISNQSGFKSRFYFMACRPSLRQQGYDPDAPLAHAVIEFLQKEGHEIGFHSGYHTLDRPALLAIEKDRLESACKNKVLGGRQHYLRFHVPGTWRHWQTAGLHYDSTLGYADCEGFRCGTSHAYKPFDLELDRQMDILEFPLIVMDTTLMKYRALSPQAGQEKILNLAQKCIQAEGIFTLLWHNTSLTDQAGPWKELYTRVVPFLRGLL